MEKRNIFARNLKISLSSIENQTFSQFYSKRTRYFSEKMEINAFSNVKTQFYNVNIQINPF